MFILLGILMRRLKFPIKFSATPLLLMLVLSILRMLIVIELPGVKVILSETLYPAIVNLTRVEIVSFRLFGLPITLANTFICVWIIGAVFLITRHIRNHNSRRPFINWLGRSTRDEYAESLLADLIGSDKHFYVFRSSCFSTPLATAFKPYIILPEIEFTPNELRVILLHEWKHIQDKDHLVGIIIDVICLVFWWNPMVYILRRNFHFAQELKCDRYSITNKKDFHHFLNGFQLVHNYQKQRADSSLNSEGAYAFISDDDESIDRLKVLALRGYSRKARILTNLCYSIVISALFIASYMFTVLPAFWESPDVSVIAEDLAEDYLETGGTLRVEENFAVDNGDGTFSIYKEGQFMWDVNEDNELLFFLPIRERE